MNTIKMNYWCDWCGEQDTPFKPTKLSSLCKNCRKEESMPKKVLLDPVTPEVLKQRYNHWLKTEQGSIDMDKLYGYSTRRDGLPEHISENIIKFAIQNHLGDRSCTWATEVGDLKSNTLLTIECKSLTSDGPISFGPKQEWSNIFFLDARGWQKDTFIIWRVSLPNTDDVWKKIKVNKNQTKEDQGDASRRPRIGWDALYPQISEHCKKVFEGKFEDIFTPAVAPAVVL